jgi:mono/diheme cytochrome c family protein
MRHPARLVLVCLAASGLLVASARGASGQTATSYSGSSLFKTYCASCHGTSAKGDGPIASSLRKKPADLTQFMKKNKGTFPVDTVAKMIDGREGPREHGNSDMPVWGDAFAQSREESDPASVKARIDALVKYLDQIQERGTQP